MMDKKEALKKTKSGDIYLEDVDKELRADKEVVLAAVKQDGAINTRKSYNLIKGERNGY